MDIVWRMAWALPLVLLVGTMAMLMLRRFVVPASAAQRQAQLGVRESLTLSDGTRVHLIEVEGRGYLVVESERHAVIQAVLPLAGEQSHSAAAPRPRWLQAFRYGGAR